MTGSELTIEPMRPGDIVDILELEKNTLSAWSRAHLENELEQPAGFQFVARHEPAGKVFGVLCGRIVADESEILKLAVAENARQKGVGAKLLDFTLNYCRAEGARICYLELRTSNEVAGKLYEHRGFRKAGIRKKYYDSPAEDAILMCLYLK